LKLAQRDRRFHRTPIAVDYTVPRILPPLMLEADLLFFDEPSAGLDPISAVELDQLILTLSRDLGITVVIVTHELPSIFLVAEQCIVLDKAAKGIVARGDPRKLRDESEIPFVHNFFMRSAPGVSASEGRVTQ